MKRSTLFFGLLVLAFIGMGFNCNNGSSSQIQPTFDVTLFDSNHIKTPKGATVYSRHSIDAAYGPAVDKQLDDLYRIAQAAPNNYKQCPDGSPCFNTQPSYTIWLIDRSPQCVYPGFTELVYSDPWPNGYDETYTDDPKNHWDKDPSAGRTILCVAGFMARGAGHQDPNANGMGVVDALPEIQNDSLPIIRYEGEHNLLFEVDRDRYAATQYHYGTNGGHPILGDGPPSFVKRQGITEQPKPIRDPSGRDLIVVK